MSACRCVLPVTCVCPCRVPCGKESIVDTVFIFIDKNKGLRGAWRVDGRLLGPYLEAWVNPVNVPIHATTHGETPDSDNRTGSLLEGHIGRAAINLLRGVVRVEGSLHDV